MSPEETTIREVIRTRPHDPACNVQLLQECSCSKQAALAALDALLARMREMEARRLQLLKKLAERQFEAAVRGLERYRQQHPDADAYPDAAAMFCWLASDMQRTLDENAALLARIPGERKQRCIDAEQNQDEVAHGTHYVKDGPGGFTDWYLLRTEYAEEDGGINYDVRLYFGDDLDLARAFVASLARIPQPGRDDTETAWAIFREIMSYPDSYEYDPEHEDAEHVEAIAAALARARAEERTKVATECESFPDTMHGKNAFQQHEYSDRAIHLAGTLCVVIANYIRNEESRRGHEFLTREQLTARLRAAAEEKEDR